MVIDTVYPELRSRLYCLFHRSLKLKSPTSSNDPAPSPGSKVLFLERARISSKEIEDICGAIDKIARHGTEALIGPTWINQVTTILMLACDLYEIRPPISLLLINSRFQCQISGTNEPRSARLIRKYMSAKAKRFDDDSEGLGGKEDILRDHIDRLIGEAEGRIPPGSGDDYGERLEAMMDLDQLSRQETGRPASVNRIMVETSFERPQVNKIRSSDWYQNEMTERLSNPWLRLITREDWLSASISARDYLISRTIERDDKRKAEFEAQRKKDTDDALLSAMRERLFNVSKDVEENAIFMREAGISGDPILYRPSFRKGRTSRSKRRKWRFVLPRMVERWQQAHEEFMARLDAPDDSD